MTYVMAVECLLLNKISYQATMSKGFHVQIVLMKKLLRKFRGTKRDKNKSSLQKPKIKITLVLKLVSFLLIRKKYAKKD